MYLWLYITRMKVARFIIPYGNKTDDVTKEINKNKLKKLRLFRPNKKYIYIYFLSTCRFKRRFPQPPPPPLPNIFIERSILNWAPHKFLSPPLSISLPHSSRSGR